MMEEQKGSSPEICNENENNYVHNPVLKQIALVNGEINRMSVRELQDRLQSHDLDARGKKQVLKSRLKMYYKRKKLSLANIKDPNGMTYHFNYLVIIDFEATCDVGQPNSFRQEIIEFPAILVNTKKKEIIDEFHSYVRPVINPRLSAFCTSLTGIKQEVVNKAAKFPEVLHYFESWLEKHGLSCNKNNFSVVSDGPWDMGRFLVMQCRVSKLPVPQWAREWINIRKTYSNFYDTKRICLNEMLMRLGMRFVGKPHSGIDDSRNIARVTLMLMSDGANLRVNERLIEGSEPNSFSVVTVSRREFEDSQLEKSRESAFTTRQASSKSTAPMTSPPQRQRGDALQSIRKSTLIATSVPQDNEIEFPPLVSITTHLSLLTTN